jgi:hypothetical protein
MDATIEETFVGEIRRKSVRRTYKIEEVGGICFYLLIIQFTLRNTKLHSTSMYIIYGYRERCFLIGHPWGNTSYFFMHRNYSYPYSSEDGWYLIKIVKF